jgi:hypothetical protein
MRCPHRSKLWCIWMVVSKSEPPITASRQAGLDVGSESNGMSSTFVSSIPRAAYSCENTYVRNGAGTAFSPRTTPNELRSGWCSCSTGQRIWVEPNLHPGRARRRPSVEVVPGEPHRTACDRPGRRQQVAAVVHGDLLICGPVIVHKIGPGIADMGIRIVHVGGAIIG